MTFMETTQKSNRYQRIIAQLKDLFAVTPDPVSRMATAAALLYHKMGHFYWVGFYRLVDGDLLIGPYQGTLACQKLKCSTGVCWEAVNQNQTIVVPDVHQFPGHIACDPKSQSEIVVPVRDTTGRVAVVLDADSDKLNTFDAIDAQYLTLIASMIYTG
jgi:L-methionine (R)-S-oxide reductase